MKFSLITVAAAATAVIVSASPIMKRAPQVVCGGYTYYASTVQTCLNNANSDAAPSSSYPHRYNNYVRHRQYSHQFRHASTNSGHHLSHSIITGGFRL